MRPRCPLIIFPDLTALTVPAGFNATLWVPGEHLPPMPKGIYQQHVAIILPGFSLEQLNWPNMLRTWHELGKVRDAAVTLYWHDTYFVDNTDGSPSKATCDVYAGTGSVRDLHVHLYGSEFFSVDWHGASDGMKAIMADLGITAKHSVASVADLLTNNQLSCTAGSVPYDGIEVITRNADGTVQTEYRFLNVS